MSTETTSEVAATTEQSIPQKPAMTESLTRSVDFVISAEQLDAATEKRLKKLAKTAKIAGFRPGHVPMARIKQMYGSQARWEALNDQVGECFYQVVQEQKLQVVGTPDIVPKEGTSEEETSEGTSNEALSFTAKFEILPEVPDANLSGVSIEQVQCMVTDEDVVRTIDVLRKQRVQYTPTDKAATKDDQANIDFEGMIDGQVFAGGAAKNYDFVLGQGRMLPEFEAAVDGLKAGQTRTFDLRFPDDYHGKDVAGKTAQFTVTVNSVSAAQLPELDSAFAKSLGLKNGDVDQMKNDIRQNLEREISNRAKAMTKSNVMEALIKHVQFDVPTAMINEDVAHLQENARNDLRARGIPVDNKMALPAELFTDRAQRRVRLGLLIAQIVKKNELHATSEQVKEQVENIASAYEDPKGFVTWYMSDKQRMAELETITMENNVVQWALKQATVSNKEVAFDELMNPQQ